MIEHNRIHATLAKIGNLQARRSSAIDRDEELRMMRLPASLDAFATKPVALLHTRRQKERRRGAIGAENFAQQRKRCDPVDVVIAVENNLLPSADRVQDSIDRGAHLREQEGIAQTPQTRPEKLFRLSIVEQAFFSQKTGNTGKSTDLRRKIRDQGWILRGGQDPSGVPVSPLHLDRPEDGRVENHQTSLSAGGAAGSNCCCAHNSPNRLKPAFSASPKKTQAVAKIKFAEGAIRLGLGRDQRVEMVEISFAQRTQRVGHFRLRG